MPSSQVKVSNLSNDSTEESVQDYFSFCGDIKSVSISASSDGRSKEAEIDFESSAAASTAVLLNNALVEGRNISVELSEDAETTTSSTPEFNNTSNASNTSINSSSSKVLSDITSQAKSVASQVSSATKDLNNKYDITGKLKSAYSNAAVTTSATFEKLDSQYDIKGKSSKAVEATKSGISSMYRQISGFWAAPPSSEGSGSINSNSPRNASNSPSPNAEK